jgi:NAD(P)-dependent dehydrogenase (short-subunit alcohol dehydrogenase family)
MSQQAPPQDGQEELNTTTDIQTSQKISKKTLTLEQQKIQDNYKHWQFIVREVPTDELIFDEEGMPYISPEELETTIRTLQLFYRFPQVAMAGSYTKNTYENFMFQQVRSNAMRWLKPADAPAVKDILALIKVQEQTMMQSTGIRNERNRKKKLLPRQCGQVYINHNEHEKLILTQAQSQVLAVEFKNDEKLQQNLPIIIAPPNSELINQSLSDGVVSLNSQASAPIQKMIKIHGIGHYTTHDSLPASAQLNHVIDNDSSVKKATSGYNVSLCDIKANFVPITKDNAKEVAQKVHSSKQGQTKNSTQSKTTTIGDVVDETMGDGSSSDVEPQTKRQRLNPPNEQPGADNTALFMRSKHSSNYSEFNPQKSANISKGQTFIGVTGNKLEIEEIGDSDDDDDDDSSMKSNSNPTKNINFGPKKFHSTNDTSVVVGLPSDSVEMASEFQKDEKLRQQLPSNPNSRYSKKGKQQQKDWVSKRGVYGGAVDVGNDGIDLEGESVEYTTGLPKNASTNKAGGIENDNVDEGQNDDFYHEDDLLKSINTIFSPKDPITAQNGPFDQEPTGIDADSTSQPQTTQTNDHRTLRRPITCYVCKASFTQLHHFYDRLCPPCASLNYKKRFQTAPMAISRLNILTNKVELIRRVCLVTGSRVKIGYEIMLKLLRAGAFVIATSRFPMDTALRLTQEPDFKDWEDNVHVYGIDFRVISSVELFIKHLLATYPRLDLIMNNAAQTIRRPPQFYRHLLHVEAQPLEQFDEKVIKLVKDFVPKEQRFSTANTQFTTSLLLSMGVNEELVKKAVLGSELLLTHAGDKGPAKHEEIIGPTQQKSEDIDVIDETCSNSTTEKTPNEPMTDGEKIQDATIVDVTKQKLISLFNPQGSNSSLTVRQDSVANSSARLVTMLSLPQAANIPSSLLTQIPLMQGDEDKASDKEIFPVGIYDKDHQQLDLRPKQTWVLKAEQVSMVEMQEVQTVNATIPFMLNTQLKPLLLASQGDPSWIINVSSMEGKFRGHKDITHPHTNMAKAALNMFTHTSSRDFAVDNIFMNAVDTGWVTEELPHGIAVHKAQMGFAPPLDEIDGAARCLDPVFTSLLTGVYEYGKFFKDYAEGHW